MRCDVLVAGGGSAGLAAAVAAARCGAKTLLVERHGSLGGMAPSAFVHSICGLYLLGDQPEPIPANPGFATEFARRLVAAGGASGPVRMGRVDVLLQHPSAFALLCDEIVSETNNLEVRFQSEIISASAGSTMQAVGLSCCGLHETVEPLAVVDATGDAVVVAMSGAGFEMEIPERLQRPAFIFSMNGVDPAAVAESGRMKIAHRLVSAVREGDLPKGALGAMLRLSGRGGEVFVTVDLDGPPDMEYDPTRAVCLTALEIYGRGLASRIAAFLRENVAGFGGSHISAFPAQVGIRESRRMTGRYRVEAGDLARGARFNDEIALASWPMELREQATGARLRFPDNGQPCGIPLRALRSKSMENLFAAGRCLSSSHEAQASLRVIGTCLATGEAAGIAAALLASGGQCEAGAVIEAREKMDRK
jgi:hypothetical protein